MNIFYCVLWCFKCPYHQYCISEVYPYFQYWGKGGARCITIPVNVLQVPNNLRNTVWYWLLPESERHVSEGLLEHIHRAPSSFLWVAAWKGNITLRWYIVNSSICSTYRSRRPAWNQGNLQKNQIIWPFAYFACPDYMVCHVTCLFPLQWSALSGCLQT